MNRKMAVNGQFYPDTKEGLLKYFSHFQSLAKQHNFKLTTQFKSRALIVPHAGYIYSGFSADVAYETVSLNSKYKRVVVFGPSHKFGFDGASVSLFENYETPLGNLKIDLNFANDLYEKFDSLDFIDEVHCEHSTETQMPFIKHYFQDIEVIEIIYGNTSSKDIEKLIKYTLEDEDNLVVISTDLSHFYTLEKATILDRICLDAIANLDTKKFDSGCEACGMIGLKALVEYASKNSYQVQFCDYRTSADITNDKQSVVGYTSFVLGI